MMLQERSERAGNTSAKYSVGVSKTDLWHQYFVSFRTVRRPRDPLQLLRIYARGALRYAEPSGKSKRKSPHQGETSAAAVARFKQAVLAES
jgi:hypothetical protein